MSNIPEHLEQFLGEMEGGWSYDASRDQMPFQVVRFGKGSGPNSIAFTTLGLSKHVLHSRVTGQELRQELMMLVPDSLRDGPVPGVLQQVGVELIETKHALLRGDVLGPRGQLFQASNMEAVYVAMPVYFPDEFAVCKEDDHDILIVWLVPITRTEAAYVRMNGWEAFEQMLVDRDPNLIDVYRPSIVTEDPT
jgi:hypothetical protein